MLIKTYDPLIWYEFMAFPIGPWHQYKQPVQGWRGVLDVAATVPSAASQAFNSKNVALTLGSSSVSGCMCSITLPSKEGPCSRSASPWCTRRHHLLWIPGLLGVSCLSSSDIVTQASDFHESRLDLCPGGFTPPAALLPRSAAALKQCVRP